MGEIPRVMVDGREVPCSGIGTVHPRYRHWWWRSSYRWPGGPTTMAPIWRPVVWRNWLSRVHGWYLVKRGY